MNWLNDFLAQQNVLLAIHIIFDLMIKLLNYIVVLNKMLYVREISKQQKTIQESL